MDKPKFKINLKDEDDYDEELKENHEEEEKSKKENMVNPFDLSPIHKKKRDAYDWFKIIVCGLTLLPIRLILLILILCINYLLIKLTIIGKSFKDLQEKPLTGWRRNLRDYSIKISTRMIIFLLGFYWINVKGKPASRNEAPVVVGNHTSWIEPILMTSQLCPMTVSKIENAKLPFIGSFFLSTQSILIAREDKNNKEGAKVLLESRPKSNLPWKQLLIYPEGTCTNGSAIVQFKQGAFLSGVPVQPVIVSWKRNKHFDPTFPIGVNMGLSFLKCLTQFVNYVDITYLDVYYPNEEEKKDPFLYAEGVRQKMASAMNVPTTNHAFEDVIMMQNAIKKNLPLNSYNTFYSNLREMSKDFSIDKAKQLLEKFASYCKNNTGKVSASEFCQALSIPFNGFTSQLFQLFDVNQDGEIDFREFVSGMFYLSSKNNAEASETIQFCFSAMDKDKDGLVDKNDFKTLFGKISGKNWPDVERLFDRIDNKRNKKISADQFIEFLKDNPEHTFIFKALAYAIVQNSSISDIRLSLLNQSINLSNFVLEDDSSK
eukprot:TRINITY_DN1775_c0_g1_i4.p1 TRINITY_DN1775_c0_g1~~TRINITY_DN1775_c0_g1_i4.p1  ORF type:complete len:544 (+),score=136.37 TRINITY_DN1775_c0_g1_i4:153-1784(+)